WGDGQRPKRGRGRIYRISYSGTNPPAAPSTGDDANLEKLVERLDASSHFGRLETQTSIEAKGRAGLNAVRRALQENRLGPIGRGHAVWILAGRGGHESLDELFALVQSDPERSVRIQAIRAIADLTDPMLREHELDCGRGDPAIAARLARLANA